MHRGGNQRRAVERLRKPECAWVGTLSQGNVQDVEGDD